MLTKLPTFKTLAKAINATYKGADKPVTSVSIDSRTIKAGQWFVAIIGPNFDGHKFIPDAIKKGAAGIITNSYQKKFADTAQIITPDTTLALGQIAKAWRENFDIPVIGITGSTGKTSTKEMLLSILKQRFNVLATPGNYNNQYGLPLTIMQLDPSHEVAIIEMGINSPKEMEYLTQIAQPTIGLITNIQPAHIGQFNSLEQILDEKWEIFKSPKIKIAIINQDDPLLKSNAEKLDLNKTHLIKYSCNPKTKEHVDISATDASWVHSVAGLLMQFKLNTPISNELIALPLIGEHWIENALAASAGALSVGASSRDIQEGLKSVTPIKGRMFPYFLQNDRILIDDTYNSSVHAVISSIHTLSKLPGKRVYIGSTLAEVGSFSEDLHRQIASELNNANFEYIYFTGDSKTIKIMQEICDKIEFIESPSGLNNLISEKLSDEAIKSILVKGARKYKLDEVISYALNQTKTQFCTQ